MIPSRDPWQRRTIMLQVDLQCVDCSYNLRGLAISSNCPECGRSVWDSLLNRSIPAFHRSTQTATVLCALLAAMPVLSAWAIAIGSSRTPIEAMVVTLLFTTLALLWAGFGWFTLAVEELRPTSNERISIATATCLAAGGIIASSLLNQSLPAVYAHWVPRAWDATLTAICVYLMLVMSPAARLMFVVGRSILARLIQGAQVLCLFAGTACLGSLMLEMTSDSDWFRPIAWRSSAIAGMCVLLIMTATSFRASGTATRRG